MGWSPDVVKTTDERFIKAVSNVLWVLDPHHKEFADCSCAIPPYFSDFQGFFRCYNNWQQKKQKEPQLTKDILQKQVDILSNYLMQPWLSGKKWGNF